MSISVQISLITLALLTFVTTCARAQAPQGADPPLVPGSPSGSTQSPRDTGVLKPPSKVDFQTTVRNAISRFEPVYVQKQSPRIAVYWNRQLNDRLSQWDSTDRTLTTGKQVNPTQGPQESESATTTQRMGQETIRANPGELWEWEFQNGFLDPFIRAGARIVDRTAILRITASKTTGSLGRAQALDVQPIELDALRGYADLFVELLLSPSPRTAGGQEFLAFVKDVKTGQILAHVTGRNTLHRPGTTHDYVATSRGFEIRDTAPPLRDLAVALAISVMDALVQVWQR